MIDATSTLTDVAFYVGTALHHRGLEQALAVASARPDVDHAIVEEWCRRSGHAAKWEVFAARYATRR